MSVGSVGLATCRSTLYVLDMGALLLKGHQAAGRDAADGERVEMEDLDGVGRRIYVM
jgi:hypothetical protein